MLFARLARTLLLIPMIAGCDEPPKATSGASSASNASPSPTAESVANGAPAGPLPPELDIAAQQRALKCATDAKSGACGVLAKMASCIAWNPIVPSGDGRWLGHGWLVEGAKTTDQITLVRARRVPTSEVGAGQLGARVAVAEIAKQEGGAYEQAERAIRAYERADVPPHGSPTLDYVKQKKDWSESFVAATAGKQIFASGSQATYFCQGPSRSLVLVQRASGAAGDGLYAELWPTSW
jgi:hypothetical protein